jgi:hypothetical protein
MLVSDIKEKACSESVLNGRFDLEHTWNTYLNAMKTKEIQRYDQVYSTQEVLRKK